MKLLLDENLPRLLKIELGPDHEVFTVRDMKWLGKKNGELLGLLTLNGFDGFITLDKNLKYQQNINRFPIRIFVLDAPNSKIETLKQYLPKLLETLGERAPFGIIQIKLITPE